MAPVRRYEDISFIEVTPGQEQETEHIKKMRKENAMRNIVIEPLASVPFPPEISVDDLVGPPKNSKQKSKSPNRFFIFRKAYVKELNRQGKRYPQTILSTYVGEHWKRLPEEQIEAYTNLAEKARILFKEKYGAIACDDKSPSRSTNKDPKKVKKRQERKRKQPRHAESHVPQVETPHTADDMVYYSQYPTPSFEEDLSFGAQFSHLSTSTQLPTFGSIENFPYVVEQPLMDDFLTSVQFSIAEDCQPNAQLPTPLLPDNLPYDSTMNEFSQFVTTEPTPGLFDDYFGFYHSS
ncbi:7040_t:CDS:1 [Acaulospora morrowiae]|uniref:7040_t:CDS:1 n=1 Tax=Acaulospora morrowiae TaxID=94023 RepID=A0A9N8VL42_9GLOM|nr:7040_t:CDS:1 [Acaulospora morrowiae]